MGPNGPTTPCHNGQPHWIPNKEDILGAFSIKSMHCTSTDFHLRKCEWWGFWFPRYKNLSVSVTNFSQTSWPRYLLAQILLLLKYILLCWEEETSGETPAISHPHPCNSHQRSVHQQFNTNTIQNTKTNTIQRQIQIQYKIQRQIQYKAKYNTNTKTIQRQIQYNTNTITI